MPLQEVDTARVFQDSKTIVDMPLKAPPAEVAAAFNQIQLPNDAQARNQTLFDFVQQVMVCRLLSAMGSNDPS